MLVHVLEIKEEDFRRPVRGRQPEGAERDVESGEVPGILAYLEGRPVGWCSVAPRVAYPVLDRSPILKRVDEKQVWSIVCFFIPKPYRRKGMSEALITAAAGYAKSRDAETIEAYPLIPENSKNPAPSVYMGLYTSFVKLGFHEVARRSKLRPIMRLQLAK